MLFVLVRQCNEEATWSHHNEFQDAHQHDDWILLPIPHVQNVVEVFQWGNQVEITNKSIEHNVDEHSIDEEPPVGAVVAQLVLEWYAEVDDEECQDAASNNQQGLLWSRMDSCNQLIKGQMLWLWHLVDNIIKISFWFLSVLDSDTTCLSDHV